MQQRKWAHDLSSGVAAALSLFDPPEQIDEALLAQVLREVARDCDRLGHTLFLRALADALDHPSAAQRLRLGNSRRGRPPGKSQTLNRALTVGPLVFARLSRGWKKEAAVQDVMTALGMSRSAVLRCCSEYERLRPLLNPVQAALDLEAAARSRKSRNS